MCTVVAFRKLTAAYRNVNIFQCPGYQTESFIEVHIKTRYVCETPCSANRHYHQIRQKTKFPGDNKSAAAEKSESAL